ncbi:alpha/beta fold hydrolase [Deinococcus terrestris]|uniref:alpha/beta fold hydrolase n=1 Tax=Deinococcus terrestris TaxID=2651870 RepID=UPI001883819E|nr:alpha/beta fold hydrolase [Deinococcus terrestris]
MAGLTRILCLHGGGLDARQWRGLRERLPEFGLLTPDLPGHGTRRGERLTLEGALQTALDVLTGRPAHIVGHSMGGALALELARRHPAQVQSLLVSGTVGPLSPGQARLMAWAARLPLPPGPALGLALRQFRIPEAEQPWVREALAPTLAPAWQADLVRLMVSLAPPEPSLVRTLVLVGALETRPARTGAARLARQLQTAPAWQVPGVGHVWNLEQPDLFAEVVRGWVRGGTLPDRLRPLR